MKTYPKVWWDNTPEFYKNIKILTFSAPHPNLHLKWKILKHPAHSTLDFKELMFALEMTHLNCHCLRGRRTHELYPKLCPCCCWCRLALQIELGELQQIKSMCRSRINNYYHHEMYNLLQCRWIIFTMRKQNKKMQLQTLMQTSYPALLLNNLLFTHPQTRISTIPQPVIFCHIHTFLVKAF